MFGLDLNAADQFCVLPVIKRQAADRPNTKQETSIDAWKKKGMRTVYTMQDTDKM